MAIVKRRVLCIDDEQDILRITRLALDQEYEVISYDSVVNAVNAAPGLKPDLILLDVMMPEMDGLTAFRELRKNEILTTVPIIFMTAKSKPEDVKKYMNLGSSAVIAKPFDPMELPYQLKLILHDMQSSEE